jgi:hypothetical protein
MQAITGKPTRARTPATEGTPAKEICQNRGLPATTGTPATVGTSNITSNCRDATESSEVYNRGQQQAKEANQGRDPLTAGKLSTTGTKGISSNTRDRSNSGYFMQGANSNRNIGVHIIKRSSRFNSCSRDASNGRDASNCQLHQQK